MNFDIGMEAAAIVCPPAHINAYYEGQAQSKEDLMRKGQQDGYEEPKAVLRRLLKLPIPEFDFSD